MEVRPSSLVRTIPLATRHVWRVLVWSQKCDNQKSNTGPFGSRHCGSTARKANGMARARWPRNAASAGVWLRTPSSVGGVGGPHTECKRTARPCRGRVNPPHPGKGRRTVHEPRPVARRSLAASQNATVLAMALAGKLPPSDEPEFHSPMLRGEVAGSTPSVRMGNPCRLRQGGCQ